MGHLSTSDRISTKLASSKAAAQGSSSSHEMVGELIKRQPSSDVKQADAITPPSNSSNNSDASSSEQLRMKTNDFQPTYHIDLDEYTRTFKGDKVLNWQFKAPLKWDKIIQISLLHAVAIIGLFVYPLEKLNLYTVLWSFFTGGLAGFGVTAGAHRYWTHRSYKANVPLRIILMSCFSLAGQNTLYDWVRDHRVHHKYSETDADPHNANRGFFFAHVGWLMMLKHPDVLRRGRQIDMSDVLADPVIQFHQKYFIPLKLVLCFLLPTAIPVYFWGESWYVAFLHECIFRYVSSLNFTWSVNSAAHMWGTRPYDKRIMPTENIYVSILAMGEGWHNYHHVFPWDYKAAELGKYSVNFTTMVLDAFHKLGWAWGMKQPSKELVKRTLEKYGDGTHESMAHKEHKKSHAQTEIHGHCHYPEVPDPEYSTLPAYKDYDEDAESSSTESTKLDENYNHKSKVAA